MKYVNWGEIEVLGLCLAVLLPVVAGLLRAARALDLGTELATGLGTGRRSRDALLLGAVLLCAVAVATAGPISFVAFMAGPIARALNGGRTTVAGAALVGAITVVAADYLAAYALPAVQLPVGVVTGAFGAPVLLWLLITSRRSA
jgi:iron complex transport system permease protein